MLARRNSVSQIKVAHFYFYSVFKVIFIGTIVPSSLNA